MLEWED